MNYLFVLLIAAVNACQEQAPKEESPAEKITDQWKMGTQLWTFHFFDFVTAIEKADSAGIKFIEAFPNQKLGIAEVEDTVFGIGMSQMARTKVKELLRLKGITLVAFGVVVPSTPEQWKQTVDFAKDMGIQYITAEPLKEHWTFADSLAGANGIKIAIHDHPKPSPYWHPDSVLAAVKDHPHIGACADIGHWGRNGLDPVECLKKLEGHIIGLHFKDIKAMNMVESEDMIVGTGVIDIPGVLSELKRQQFNGMFSIEREENWYNNVPDVKQTITYFNEQVSKLK